MWGVEGTKVIYNERVPPEIESVIRYARRGATIVGIMTSFVTEILKNAFAYVAVLLCLGSKHPPTHD